MKYLKIKNQGELDIRLIALMGGTTKSNQDYKIGQFGTGLKYTLAFLLRNNIDFKIIVGEKKADINIECENICGEDFEIICINNNRTSITTRMGLEWEAWMIIRELWCNALDEGGAEKEIVDLDLGAEVKGNPNETCFYIQINNQIREVLDNWGSYFIHDKQPLYKNEMFAIYAGGDDLRIYKQGVLVKEEKGKKCLFNYDSKLASINELRQFQGSISHLIFQALSNPSEQLITYFLENVKESHFEGSECDYNWYDSFGESWKKTIGKGKLIHQKAVDNIKARGLEIDLSDKIIVPQKVYEALTKNIEGIGALRVSAKINEFYESYNSKVENRVKQGLVILETAGYDFSPNIKFIYGVFGDKTINAQVNTDTAEVYISENFLDKSLHEICEILIEECEHYKTGYQDCSRSFQSHFIKLYTKQLLKSSNIEL